MEYTYIDRIKLLKNEKKITNDKLSELTGIPLGTLSKILAGISDSPKLSNIVAICDALDCSVDYILTGVPENTNNYTLDDSEIDLINDYRALDSHGRELVALVIEKESERCAEAVSPFETKSRGRILSVPTRAAAQKPVSARQASGLARRPIDLYDLPVSAGTGIYITDMESVEINIPNTPQTREATFALRIKGNSMLPKYRDGDVLLIEESETVEYGELGVFILDGDGYFKKFGGDRLISLNPEYEPILLKNFSEIVCCGKVIGKLKRK